MKKSRNKTVCLFIIFILLITILVLLSYKAITSIKSSSKYAENTIAILAWDYDKTSGSTVYIKENETYIPYIVLTNNYDKNTLLLRKYLLDEMQIYNENVSFGAYYPESYIDNYLNTTFFDTLSEETKNIISLTNIETAKKDILGVVGDSNETKTIQRKIFLLSAIEIGHPSTRTTPKEGKKLKYFSNSELRKASNKEGEESAWWTRTPNTWHDNVVYGVNTEGSIGIGGINYESGVRPAFTVPNNTKIKQMEEASNSIYVIE